MEARRNKVPVRRCRREAASYGGSSHQMEVKSKRWTTLRQYVEAPGGKWWQWSSKKSGLVFQMINSLQGSASKFEISLWVTNYSYERLTHLSFPWVCGSLSTKESIPECRKWKFLRHLPALRFDIIWRSKVLCCRPSAALWHLNGQTAYVCYVNARPVNLDTMFAECLKLNPGFLQFT
jgi:hypothetical protein